MTYNAQTNPTNGVLKNEGFVWIHCVALLNNTVLGARGSLFIHLFIYLCI